MLCNSKDGISWLFLLPVLSLLLINSYYFIIFLLLSLIILTSHILVWFNVCTGLEVLSVFLDVKFCYFTVQHCFLT